MTTKLPPILASLILLVVGVVLFTICAFIYGAPLIGSSGETLVFASFLTTLTILPCCCVLGPDMDAWYKVIFKNSPESNSEMVVRLTTICTVIGAWLGAFPIPLDWDRPWQVWPISSLFGCLLGFCAGLILSPLQHLLNQKHSHKVKTR